MEQQISKKKDWVGTGRAVFVCNGATGHAQEDRGEYDFYASEPACAKWLLEIEPQITKIWENCVGGGHLAEEFRKAGKLGAISDLVDRGYYPERIPTKYGDDFLQFKKVWKGDIATNPPFISSSEWVEHSLELLTEGHYLALFMKITFLEGKGRRELFKKYPPIRVWVSSSRLNCAKNGDFEKYGKGSAACYCWFIWQKGYKGSTELKWFN
jgi:hypothetical protein